MKRILISCIAVCCSLVSIAYADTTIVIIRHGEKPTQGLGQLSCQGLNRALALPQVLLTKFGIPAAIYAPNPAVKKSDKGVMYTYVRPLATIEPLAVRVGLPINLDWSMSEVAPLAEALIKSEGGTQLVAWEHHLGEKLAKILVEKLGGKVHEVPEWADNDFDSIYIVRVTELNKLKRVSFTRDSEGLNNLPETCNP